MGKIGIMELIVVLFFVIAFFLPVVFYLITLQSTLNEVSLKNRRMNPGEVWLMLIPIFGLVWQFIMGRLSVQSLLLGTPGCGRSDGRRVDSAPEVPGVQRGQRDEPDGEERTQRHGGMHDHAAER